MKKTYTCKKDVIANGKEDVGKILFKEGKKYKVELKLIGDVYFSIVAIGEDGKPHVIFQAYAPKSDSKFLFEHFNVDSLIILNET